MNPDKLENRYNQLTKAAEILADEINDANAIKNYMLRRAGQKPLSLKQIEDLKRYHFIFEQLSSGKIAEAQMAFTVMQLYGRNQNDAYLDIRIAKQIFTSIINFEKKEELFLLKNVLDIAIGKAVRTNDLSNLSKLSKIKLDVIKEMPETEPDSDSNFEGHTILATYDPELLGVEPADMTQLLERINEKREKKISIVLPKAQKADNYDG